MELYDEKRMAVCQVCGKSFDKISYKHLLLHGLSSKEYREMYPEAPLISDASKIRMKFAGAKSKIFKDKNKILENTKIHDLVDVIEPIENESQKIIDLKKIDPNMKIIESKVLSTYPDPNNCIPVKKLEILSFLINKFPDVKNSFSVEKYTVGGFLEYKFITDICIPSLKIDIEFPNAFYHNFDVVKYSRDLQLKNDKWKIIDIYDDNPTVESLIQKLKEEKILI